MSAYLYIYIRLYIKHCIKLYLKLIPYYKAALGLYIITLGPFYKANVFSS